MAAPPKPGSVTDAVQRLTEAARRAALVRQAAQEAAQKLYEPSPLPVAPEPGRKP